MSDYIKDFKKEFPNCWFKDGSDFDGSESRIIWSGEGSEIDDLPAFDQTLHADTLGVHPKLEEFAELRGLYFEAYDPGTFFAYEA